MMKHFLNVASDVGPVFIRLKVQRKVALGMDHDVRSTGKRFHMPGLADLIGQFTPDGLQKFIDARQSLIEAWARGIPPELRVGGIKDLLQLGVDNLEPIVTALDWEKVLDHVATRHPAQVLVIRAERNRPWLEPEKRRATRVMLDVLHGKVT